MTQSRWKSKVLWAAIAAQIIALLAFTGILDKLGLTEDWLNNVVGGIMQLLVLFGVVNNPTDSENV